MSDNLYFKYDPESGDITDKNGRTIYYCDGEYCEPFSFHGKGRLPISDMVELKNAGFTTKEIMTLLKLEE